MKNTWRDKCTPIILQVLKDFEGRPQNELKKALYEAYPFGMRQYHPYKIWLDEIKRLTGKQRPKPYKNKKRKAKEAKEVEANKNQLSLFGLG